MRSIAIVALAGLIPACAPRPDSAVRMRPDRLIALRGHSLPIHLSNGTSHSAGPLLVYLTGDGGWPGDERLFDQMMPWGYPMAAISSADYIATLDNAPDRAITPAGLAADGVAVLDASLEALALPPATPAVLVGFSRGSGLAIAAATDARVRDRLRGILAIALTGEEEYVVDRPPAPGGAASMLMTYETLPRLDTLRIAVIQSTRDEFVPAAEAERRFGPTGPIRWFRAIDAADHSFGGRLPALASEMKAGVDWILR